ncbi:hypothetical protein JVU11DRAFT_8074 [Chiua virens]|nr:hypothetical protein JVU11DRAFT_8074 [Chiua virens]
MADNKDHLMPTVDPTVVADEDAPDPPISVPEEPVEAGEGGKLKMIVQLVKKCLGVKDIAAMRLSLPASLLEPMPNLEYWHYLDRPDLFAAINDSDDAFERMLAVVRFTFTKDLKFIHGKVCKPYNSVLGEHFRAHWDVPPVRYSSDPRHPPILGTHTTQSNTSPQILTTALPSETLSVKSGRSERSSKSTRSGLSLLSKAKASPSTAPTSPHHVPDADLAGRISSLSLGDADVHRVVYITEQVSHHPPVSAYYAICPARSIEMRGIDQISAKISGTTVRVTPGSYNKGIFININGGPGEGEEYHITHPVAGVNGILRGSFYVTVADSTIITCTGGKGEESYRAVIEYKEEVSRLLDRRRLLLIWSHHGCSHGLGEPISSSKALSTRMTKTKRNTRKWTKVKHVPQSRVVAFFDGCWRNHIRWRRNPSGSDVSVPLTSEFHTLVDLEKIQVVPKVVRPLEKQFPNESRKLWENVTSKLLSKEYGDATKYKLALEQRQRDEASERTRKGEEFIPAYFEKDFSLGIPTLTEEGRKAVEEELRECSPDTI